MAIDWLHNNGGVMTMNDYPTRANYSGPCQFDAAKAKTQITGYMNVTKNETIIKDALYKLGPLSILLDFTGMTYYKSGIANPRWCGTWPDHALLLVGYGTKDGDYWLVKNSWGTTSKYRGIWYCSDSFLRSKTIDVVVHKDALSKDLKKKLGIK